MKKKLRSSADLQKEIKYRKKVRKAGAEAFVFSLAAAGFCGGVSYMLKDVPHFESSEITWDGLSFYISSFAAFTCAAASVFGLSMMRQKRLKELNTELALAQAKENNLSKARIGKMSVALKTK